MNTLICRLLSGQVEGVRTSNKVLKEKIASLKKQLRINSSPVGLNVPPIALIALSHVRISDQRAI